MILAVQGKMKLVYEKNKNKDNHANYHKERSENLDFVNNE
jgi:hypothetical protein